MKKIQFSTPNTDSELRGFGIYAITNIENGKAYIGSVTSFSSFRERWIEHRRLLIRGAHVNSHLQNSWNKHGIGKFTFSVLEQCSSNEGLLPREQFYMDRCGDSKYNICPIAGNTIGIRQSAECIRKKSKEWVFVSPSNEVFNVVNMRMFCRQMNLPQTHMINVANGVERHHKKWLAYPKEKFSSEQMNIDVVSRRPRTVKIISPHNEEFVVDNINAFSKQHGLDVASMFHCLEGRDGRTKHKGWTIKRI